MTVLSELVVVRHGEATCNVTGVVGGARGCTGLTDVGRRQAHQLARRLAAEHADAPFGLFHTTPRLRVRQTADVIATVLGVTPLVTADLRAPDPGTLDGQRWADVRRAFGGNLRRHPNRRQGPDSETWHEYLTRAHACLRAILRQGAGQRILVVGHLETVEAAHTLLLGLGPGASRAGFVSHHAAIARWRQEIDVYGHEMWKLATHNDTMHLTGGGCPEDGS